MAQTEQPIVIIRRKAPLHGNHHGGAWKVAYADFVTAMMSLFMVMWLMASSQQVKKSIAAYFDPQGKKKSEMSSGGVYGSGTAVYLSISDLKDLKAKLERSLRLLPAAKDQILMTVTSEGLRIELLETSEGVFFASGNARPTTIGEQAISLLAGELAKLPYPIVIEGHTDASSYSVSHTYTNWELSTDRAHTARRLMQAHGVRPDQIKQIRGYGDLNLRHPTDPRDPSNRRISVIVLSGEGSLETMPRAEFP